MTEWNLEAWIGGWPGPSYSIRGCGSTITYEHAARHDDGITEQVTLEIPAKELTAFWEDVDAIRVSDWAPEYADPNVCDGTQWNILLEHRGRRIESSGSNAYPQGFKSLCAALSRVCEGRPFE